MKRWCVVTSTASAVIPLLNGIELLTCDWFGVNDTWIAALALWFGASEKLDQVTLLPLAAIVPVLLEADTTRTFGLMWFTTVWLKSRVWTPLLVTISVMVQVVCCPTTMVPAQLADWDRLKGTEGAVMVKMALA